MTPPRSAPSAPPGSRALTIKIITGMILGFLVGLAINLYGVFIAEDAFARFMVDYGANGLFLIVGDVFVRLLQVIVIPLVFVSLVCGTASLSDITQLGRLGTKTVGLYLMTTAIAISVAMTAALIVKPGSHYPMEEEAEWVAQEAPPLVEVIVSIFPRNIVEATSKGEMLPLIVFAILFGIAMSMAGEAGKRGLALFEDFNEIIMKLVWVIMALAPYGVFALIARTFATQGFGAFVPLLKYFLLVLFVLILHALVTYPLLLKFLGRLRPIHFLKKMRSVQIFAFSTSSSNATIPVSLQVAEKQLGVKRSVASFTIPLGATINMDGTAIMQGVATVFIAQVYGIDLTAMQLLMVILTATLASIGTAGVPGVGLIMLAMVLVQAGLPVEGVGLIIGIDRLLDMVRTAVNVTGDCAISCIVANSEGTFDQDVFDREVETAE